MGVGIFALENYNHHCLTDTGLESTTKLEFKQRISIGLGAAKGINEMFHSLSLSIQLYYWQNL